MPSLDTAFAALADPTRLAIVSRLAVGEATVNELAAPFAISQPAVSRHIKVLEDAGLILRRIDGTHRPCRLAPQALDSLNEWLSNLRLVMEHNYLRLDALLAEPDPRKDNS
jgi:DNA-binding transcriptional ArsR family regulator